VLFFGPPAKNNSISTYIRVVRTTGTIRALINWASQGISDHLSVLLSSLGPASIEQVCFHFLDSAS